MESQTGQSPQALVCFGDRWAAQARSPGFWKAGVGTGDSMMYFVSSEWHFQKLIHIFQISDFSGKWEDLPVLDCVPPVTVSESPLVTAPGTRHIPAWSCCLLRRAMGRLPSPGPQARRPSREETGAQWERSGLMLRVADPRSRKSKPQDIRSEGDTEQHTGLLSPAPGPSLRLLLLHNGRSLEPPLRSAEVRCVSLCDLGSGLSAYYCHL